MLGPRRASLQTDGALHTNIGSDEAPVSSVSTISNLLDTSARDDGVFAPLDTCNPMSVGTEYATGYGYDCRNLAGGPGLADNKGHFIYGLRKGTITPAGSATIQGVNPVFNQVFGAGMHVVNQDTGVDYGPADTRSYDNRRHIYTFHFPNGTSAAYNDDDSLYTRFQDIFTTARAPTRTSQATVKIASDLTGVVDGEVIFDRDGVPAQSSTLQGKGGYMIGEIQSYDAKTGVVVLGTPGAAASTNSLVTVVTGDNLGITAGDGKILGRTGDVYGPGAEPVAGGVGASYQNLQNANPTGVYVNEGMRVTLKGFSNGAHIWGHDDTIQAEYGALGDMVWDEVDLNNHTGRSLPGSYALWFQSTSQNPIGAGILFSQAVGQATVPVDPEAYSTGIQFQSGVVGSDISSTDEGSSVLLDFGAHDGSTLTPVAANGTGISLGLYGLYGKAALDIATPASSNSSNSDLITWTTRSAPPFYNTQYAKAAWLLGAVSGGSRFRMGSVAAPIQIDAAGNLTSPGSLTASGGYLTVGRSRNGDDIADFGLAGTAFNRAVFIDHHGDLDVRGVNNVAADIKASGPIIAGSYIQSGVSTVENLAACDRSLEGARSGVTDATAKAFGSKVLGGGSHHLPVYCDGRDWIVE